MPGSGIVPLQAEIIQRKEKILPYYENVFIARQDISATQVEGLVETFEKVITDNAGTVAKTESWGLRSLAYRIKKIRVSASESRNAAMNVTVFCELATCMTD